MIQLRRSQARPCQSYARSDPSTWLVPGEASPDFDDNQRVGDYSVSATAPAALSRYGYAGAWGYETGLDDAGEPDLPPLPFIHVGERWYDPSSGRFLQRDPIGIIGGLNVFAYVMSEPVTSIDPSGLESSADRLWRMHDRAVMEGRYDDARTIRDAASELGALSLGLLTGLVCPPVPLGIIGCVGGTWTIFNATGGSTGDPQIDRAINLYLGGASVTAGVRGIVAATGSATTSATF